MSTCGPIPKFSISIYNGHQPIVVGKKINVVITIILYKVINVQVSLENALEKHISLTLHTQRMVR